MSARLSTAFPLACSGGMYAAVPRITPTSVAPMVSVGEFSGLSEAEVSLRFVNAFARPKSSSLTTPSGVTMMLAGFRSRWMIPLSWAYSSADAI